MLVYATPSLTYISIGTSIFSVLPSSVGTFTVREPVIAICISSSFAGSALTCTLNLPEASTLRSSTFMFMVKSAVASAEVVAATAL